MFMNINLKKMIKVFKAVARDDRGLRHNLCSKSKNLVNFLMKSEISNEKSFAHKAMD